jgi:hypothetical protein
MCNHCTAFLLHIVHINFTLKGSSLVPPITRWHYHTWNFWSLASASLEYISKVEALVGWILLPHCKGDYEDGGWQRKSVVYLALWITVWVWYSSVGVDRFIVKLSVTKYIMECFNINWNTSLPETVVKALSSVSRKTCTLISLGLSPITLWLRGVCLALGRSGPTSEVLMK